MAKLKSNKKDVWCVCVVLFKKKTSLPQRRRGKEREQRKENQSNRKRESSSIGKNKSKGDKSSFYQLLLLYKVSSLFFQKIQTLHCIAIRILAWIQYNDKMSRWFQYWEEVKVTFSTLALPLWRAKFTVKRGRDFNKSKSSSKSFDLQHLLCKLFDRFQVDKHWQRTKRKFAS